MSRWFLVAMVSLAALTAGCGKNDAVRAVGTIPTDPIIVNPPVPPTGPVQPPSNPGPGTFNPGQVPPNYGNQFYPFMPVYQYFQANYQMQQYWYQLWASWQYYAQYYRYNQYDFRYFWLEYCPQVMPTQTYNTFDYYFYQNVTYQSSFNQSYSSSSYWQNYSGFDFYNMPGYSCYDCYYW